MAASIILVDFMAFCFLGLCINTLFLLLNDRIKKGIPQMYARYNPYTIVEMIIKGS